MKTSNIRDGRLRAAPLILILCLLPSCAPAEKSLVGTWRLQEESRSQLLGAQEDAVAMFSLFADGTFSAIELPLQPLKPGSLRLREVVVWTCSGTWELGKDGARVLNFSIEEVGGEPRSYGTYLMVLSDRDGPVLAYYPDDPEINGAAYLGYEKGAY